MLEILNNNIIPCFINELTVIYINKKILNKNVDYKSYKNYLAVFVGLIFAILNFFYVINFFRFIISTIYTILIIYFMFDEKIKKVIFSVSLQQFIFLIAEFIYAVLLFFINENIEFFSNDIMGTLKTSIFVSFFAIIIYNNSYVSKKCDKIINVFNNFNYGEISITLICFLFVMNLLLFISFYGMNDKNLLIVNFIFVLLSSVFIIILINEKNKNLIFMQENKILLANLNEYEKMLDYQRISNHENKNQLLIIKSMIERRDSKITEYLDEIIKENRNDNEVIYSKAKRIPSGGLQGLIYQKMLLMQENYIEINLDVSSQVRKIDLSNISAKMNYDICRIIGVILDNAIEETMKFNKKEREVSISMYVDNLFIIEISNRIKENIDINKISNNGYTTKEKGHGYGLSLLNKIVNENDKIFNDIRIVNNIFTQIIKIKM